MQARHPATAVKISAEIETAAERVGQFPFSGRPQDVPCVRKIVTSGYKYLIYYLVNEPEDAVDILTVQHPARVRRYEDT